MEGSCKSGAKSPNSRNAVCFLTSWGSGEDGLLCMELGMQLNNDCPKSGRHLNTRVVAIDKVVTILANYRDVPLESTKLQN